MGQISLMNHTGDENVVKWGSSEAERTIARQTFDSYVSRGFTMFAMDEDDNRGERITRFDPEMHGIIAVPRMVGG